MLRTSLFLLALSAGASVLAQEQPPATAAARPGERELKEVLASLASLGSFQASVTKFTGSGGDSLQEMDGGLILSWRGASSYRAQYQGMWGDTLLVIREGNRILSDSLDVGGTATLRDAGEKFQDSWSASGADMTMGPYPMFFLGEAALGILAPAAAAIEYKSVGTRSRRFVITGGRYGTLTFQASKGEKSWVLDFVETGRQSARGFGSSIIRMETASISRLPKTSASFWLASPEKGIGLNDLRAKKEG